MAGKRTANVLVLGSQESPYFGELKALPAEANVVGIGLADELLDIEDDKLATVNVLLNTGFGVKTDQFTDMKKLWPKLPGLKWVHAASAGVTHILTDDLVNSDVTLTNAKGTFSSSLAEYALTSCLYFAKKLQVLQAQQKAAQWNPICVRDLRGTTLGIVGFGDIGQACARLGKAFGMEILALRRRVELSREEEKQGLKVFPPQQLNEMVAACDYIVAALPSTPATDKFIDADAIAAMKPSCVFVNLGRGTTVDEAALTQALQEGRIRGAALDVFEEEPLPQSSPLWQLDNVLVSPHCADRTDTFLHDAVAQFVSIVHDYTAGKPLRNVCDKAAGY